MNGSRLPWIILGLMAAMFVLVIGLAAVLIGTDLLDLDRLNNPGEGQGTPTLAPDQVGPGIGVIEGFVWHDLCANNSEGQAVPLEMPAGCVLASSGGLTANGLHEAGEPGLGAIAVFLGEGVCPSIGLATQITRGDGYYSFDGLRAGTYCVSIDSLSASNAAQLLPGGWTAPRTSAAQAGVTITIAEGERRNGVDFGWDYQFLPVPPTPTITPTVTLTPTPTLTPTATPVPIPCDWVAFVKDVTVPDGMVFKPDRDFTKTWQVKNIGTCTWTKNYALVYVSGERMTGDKVTNLSRSVAPGQTIDISIELTAPVEAGKHVGYWALRNASGKVFGIGPKALEAFWVSIRVEKPKTLAYDLATHVCDASWVSGAGIIACPSEAYDVAGLVRGLNNPVMEGNRKENEAGIQLIPEGIADGYIRGTFPAFGVKKGDSFRSVVSCMNDSLECDVQFRLSYQIGDGEIKTIEKWNERYDGKYTAINVDLSSLAGNEVKFILEVRARDVFDQDSALWLHPSIWR